MPNAEFWVCGHLLRSLLIVFCETWLKDQACYSFLCIFIIFKSLFDLLSHRPRINPFAYRVHVPSSQRVTHILFFNILAKDQHRNFKKHQSRLVIDTRLFSLAKKVELVSFMRQNMCLVPNFGFVGIC